MRASPLLRPAPLLVFLSGRWQGFPGSIPPESTLTFVVKLYSVSPQAVGNGFKSSSSPGF